MENLGAAYWASDEGELATRIYWAVATGSVPAAGASVAPTPAAASEGEAPGLEGEQKLSKNALKKLKSGKAEKPAKVKDANQWAVDPEKKAAKAAEKAAKAAADAERNAAEAAAQVATPAGHKKILTKELATVYMPEMVEAAWQEWWEASGFYSADAAAGAAAGPEGRFVIVIPPPNVTGSLHLGHALTAAIEDALTRWHRMKGDVALYVPGTDHAGIATQVGHKTQWAA
jgi:valyl-tRNA synthetase